MLAPILPLGIDGSHPALRLLRFDVAQGIVAFCFQDQVSPSAGPRGA
jgi:hypothetical protein